jgi:hypothetical protein
LNGDFQTKGKGSLEAKFFDYSNSREVYLTPDIVEYEGISAKDYPGQDWLNLR